MQEELLEYIEKELLSGRSTVKVTSQDDLMGSGLIDSMGMMRLVRFVEEQYDLRVPPEDLVIENFMTVEDINNYLVSRKTSS